MGVVGDVIIALVDFPYVEGIFVVLFRITLIALKSILVDSLGIRKGHIAVGIVRCGDLGAERFAVAVQQLELELACGKRLVC